MAATNSKQLWYIDYSTGCSMWVVSLFLLTVQEREYDYL